MKLKQSVAAFGAAVLLAVAAAMPASAHHGHGNCCGVIAAANVLGETSQAVAQQAKISNVCMGAMMAQLGKLEEFHAERLRLKEEQLQAQVENGIYTQAEAEDILTRMEERQAACDGTGYGYGNGNCDGTGYGNGYGNGNCDGTGYGNGYGNGNCDGTGYGNGGHHGGGRHCR